MVSFLGKDVFAARHQQIREWLEQEGYAAFLVLSPDNFYYLTGYFLDVAPWERPVVGCIPRVGEPFLVMNELSTNHIRMAKARGSLAVDEVHIWKEHVSSTIRGYTLPQWTELVAAVLRTRGIDRGVLACDSGFGQLLPLTRSLPKVQFVLEPNLLVAMRTVKCAEELELVRQCAKLTDYGQSVWRDLVKPGRLMAEVDAETSKFIRCKGAELFPGSRIDLYLSSLCGPASASPHGTGADADLRIAYGQGIVNILIVRLNGYNVENERTWIVGEASELQARAFQAATDACLAATRQLVAGNVVSSVDAAAQAVIEAAGFGEYINHRTGHGLGIAGHEFPENIAFNHRLLQENEVWSAEPGIYIYGVGGFRHDDTVIVGADAPEVVTTWSKSLAEQTIKV